MDAPGPDLVLIMQELEVPVFIQHFTLLILCQIGNKHGWIQLLAVMCELYLLLDLEIATLCLVGLDGFKQGLEVASTETLNKQRTYNCHEQWQWKLQAFIHTGRICK